jgi:hypothetical protein
MVYPQFHQPFQVCTEPLARDYSQPKTYLRWLRVLSSLTVEDFRIRNHRHGASFDVPNKVNKFEFWSLIRALCEAHRQLL